MRVVKLELMLNFWQIIVVLSRIVFFPFTWV